MKIGTKKIVSLLVVLAALFVFASCGKAEEEQPILTITSEKNAEIELNESYTLEYTTKHAKTVDVEVSGGENGSYDEETKTFTATSSGEYTLTVTATNVKKTVTDSVKVIVKDPADPVIIFEGEIEELYKVNLDDEFVLPKATAKDAFDEVIEVEVKSSDTEKASVTKNDDGDYVFVGKKPGEVSVIYTASDDYGNEVTKTLEFFVMINIEPTITFTSDVLDEYEVNVDEEITLPGAVAKDALGKEIEIEVYPTLQRGVEFEQNEDGTYSFTASVAGVHLVSYYAEDDYGNYREEFIEVTVIASNEETEINEEENNIDNLNTSNLVFKENFEKGYNSPLAKGIVWDGNVKISIEGNDKAISGNSMIFDYAEATATTNTAVYFGALDQYIKSGRWEISFDVKLIKGNIPGFYVSFIFEGDNSGDNLQYQISKDEVTRINYNYVKTFDEDKTWYFRLFTYTGDSSFNYDGLQLALDNFEFKWIEVEDATAKRTGTPKTIEPEDLDGDGYTLTGSDDNFTALGGNGNPRWVFVDKLVSGDILTEEQAQYITPENGFNSDYVIHATTQQVYFESLKNLITDPEYIYTITYKVFSPTNDSWYFWIAKEDTSQAFAQRMPGGAGVKTFTHTIKGDPNYVNVGLYSGDSQDLIVGDIHVKRELYQIGDETPNGYQVGETWVRDSFLEGVVNASEISIGEDLYLDSIEGFDGQVLQLLDESDNADKNVTALNVSNIFEQSGKYKITFKLYILELENGPLMVNFDNAVFEPILETFDEGIVEVEYELTGKTANFLSLYTQPGTIAEVYLSSISIELIEIV